MQYGHLLARDAEIRRYISGMDPREAELRRFKTEINLTEFAAGHGFGWDRSESSRSSVVMRRFGHTGSDGSDKIVIARMESGIWTYFSVHDESNNGTIVDFVQRDFPGHSLGDVRKLLRRWLDTTERPVGDPQRLIRPARGTYRTTPLPPISRDLASVHVAFAATRNALESDSYLAGVRDLPDYILSSSRFYERIKTDSRGNAVFPHFNRDGLCGFEIKNVGFTGFSPGGTKGLWGSRISQERDRRLVIAESAIDALSYAAFIHQQIKDTRFVSMGGAPGPLQLELLTSAMVKLPNDSEVVLALDRDDAGRALAEKIHRDLFEPLGREDLTLRTHLPDKEGCDWNDILVESIPNLTAVPRTWLRRIHRR